MGRNLEGFIKHSDHFLGPVECVKKQRVGYLAVTMIEKILLDNAEHEDRGTNTLNDNYTLDGLKLISRYLFNRNTAHHLRD